MKIPPVAFSCKKRKESNHNFFSQKKEVTFKRKKMNKKKHFIPKKDIDEARRKKANTEKVGKIIFLFWFTDDS